MTRDRRTSAGLLVPQAHVLWFEHVLISGFVAKDEVQSMHSLHDSPAREHKEPLSHVHSPPRTPGHEP